MIYFVKIIVILDYYAIYYHYILFGIFVFPIYYIFLVYI